MEILDEASEKVMKPVRILALDVGTKRVGLAVTDALGLAPQGLPTLHRTTLREDLKHVAGIMRERDVARVIVGDPKHMAGAASNMSAYVRGFGDRLQSKTRVPVEYRDERLTSLEAEERLRELGITWTRDDGNLDRMAAILILEEYLQTCPQEETDGCE